MYDVTTYDLFDQISIAVFFCGTVCCVAIFMEVFTDVPRAGFRNLQLSCTVSNERVSLQNRKSKP